MPSNNQILQELSDIPTLKLDDLKEGLKVKCVAENEGGRRETPFEVYVAGMFVQLTSNAFAF